MSTKSAPATSTTKTRRRKSRRAFGTVRQLRSGRWQARWEDKQGRTHTGPHTFETERAADNWLSTVRADLVRGVWRSPDLGSDTLAGYMRGWVEQRTDLALSTRAGYEIALTRWVDRDLTLPAPRGGRPIRVNIGTQPLNAITPSMIREWYAAAHATQVRERTERDARGVISRASRGKTSHVRAWARAHGWSVSDTGRLSPEVTAAWVRAGRPGDPGRVTSADIDPSAVKPAAVVVQAYRYLRACLNAALSDGLITSNPCRVKGGGSFTTRERPHAAPGEVRALGAAMPPRFAEAVDLAAWSALRAGELFALARRHVDLEARTITVERSLVDVAGHPLSFGPPKTPSSLRTVSLPASVVDRLRDHMDAYTGPEPDALVFAHEDGTPVDRAQRGRMFDRARRVVGRPDLRWHDLRHTGSTLAARAGASVSELQHRLGHSTFQAAMRYQHASADRDRELADRLDAYATAERHDLAPILHLA
jgi:integrase